MFVVTLDATHPGTMPPGAGNQFHRHPGDQWTAVQEGEVTFTVKGEPPKVLKAGESNHVPRGTVHRQQNLTDKPENAFLKQIPNVVAVGGGVPIKVGNEVIGAVGISGPSVTAAVQAARMPAWRMPPPRILRQRCAALINAAEPHNNDPTGAANPLDRQTDTDVCGARHL